MIAAATMPNPAEVSNDHFAVIVGGLVTLLGALITFAGIITPLLIRARNDAKVARDQTANDHGTNLRTELDERHDETLGNFRLIVASVEGLTATVGSLQRGQSALYELVRGHTSQLAELEDTLDGRPSEIVIEPTEETP